MKDSPHTQSRPPTSDRLSQEFRCDSTRSTMAAVRVNLSFAWQPAGIVPRRRPRRLEILSVAEDLQRAAPCQEAGKVTDWQSAPHPPCAAKWPCGLAVSAAPAAAGAEASGLTASVAIWLGPVTAKLEAGCTIAAENGGPAGSAGKLLVFATAAGASAARWTVVQQPWRGWRELRRTETVRRHCCRRAVPRRCRRSMPCPTGGHQTT